MAVRPGCLWGRAAGACRSAVAVLRLAGREWLQLPRFVPVSCSAREACGGCRARATCMPAQSQCHMNKGLRHALPAPCTLSKGNKLACMQQRCRLPGPDMARPDAAVPLLARRWREPAWRAGQAGGRGACGYGRRRRPCAAHAAGGAADCHAAQLARRVRSSQPGLLIPWCICLLVLLPNSPSQCATLPTLAMASCLHCSMRSECSHPVTHGARTPYLACPSCPHLQWQTVAADCGQRAAPPRAVCSPVAARHTGPHSFSSTVLTGAGPSAAPLLLVSKLGGGEPLRGTCSCSMTYRRRVSGS